MRSFEWHEVNDLGWPWTIITHSVSKICVFGAQHENLNEDRNVLYQRRRFSPVTVDSGNIRFMRILAGVPWSGGGALNDSGVIENVDFQCCLQMLYLRNLRKWDQRCYTILFSLCHLSSEPNIRDRVELYSSTRSKYLYLYSYLNPKYLYCTRTYTWDLSTCWQQFFFTSTKTTKALRQVH